MKKGVFPSAGMIKTGSTPQAERTQLLQLLRHAVGEQRGQAPEVPGHSAALSASLVQAVVLDRVGDLEQLHSALQQERSQRPTP